MAQSQQIRTIVSLYVMIIITILLMILTMMFLKFPMNKEVKLGDDKTIIILNDSWKFKPGDNLEWANPEKLQNQPQVWQRENFPGECP